MRLYYTQIPKQPTRQAQHEAEHRAGRALLCHALGCEEGDILLRGDGKPYLPGGPWFSISHSGGLVLLAVSELGEIGCDVEDTTRPLRSPERIRAKIADPGEETLPLFQLWVKKEAEYKACGPGYLYYPPMPEGFIAAVCCRAEEEVATAPAKFIAIL